MHEGAEAVQIRTTIITQSVGQLQRRVVLEVELNETSLLSVYLLTPTQHCKRSLVDTNY